MQNLKVKTEFLGTVIGFNNSALPLGKRNDLHILADMAVKSQDPKLLNLFEELPTKSSVNEAKEAKILEETENDQTQPQTNPETITGKPSKKYRSPK